MTAQPDCTNCVDDQPTVSSLEQPMNDGPARGHDSPPRDIVSPYLGSHIASTNLGSQTTGSNLGSQIGIGSLGLDRQNHNFLDPGGEPNIK